MNLTTYLHTLRHLRPVQIYGRLWFHAVRPRPDLRPAPSTRTPGRRWVSPAWRPALMTSPQAFRLLNTAATIGSAGDWTDPSRDSLLAYNLHYFDDLTANAAAARTSWHQHLIGRWIQENPPGRGIGWDPYPTSLRLVNWIKWCWSSEHGDRSLDEKVRQSVAVQARWLMRRLEIHLLGNHLWANAKALAFAGAFFDGAEAREWRETAVRLLDAELAEQILADGGHFERTPMYHAIVLEDLLDLRQLERVTPGTLPAALADRIERVAGEMFAWLRTMTHPDGQISFFNDAVFGVAPTCADLENYAAALGLGQPADDRGSITLLADSGYVRLETDRAVVICDVGPIGPDYLPAHAHADSLSFEVSLDGRRVLVNSGTSTYAAGRERSRQRGTASHNTVVVDRQDSSEMWGSFRVARRARPFDVTTGTTPAGAWAEASHDGYRRLPGRVVHRRRWALEPTSLTIDDTLSGQFSSAQAYWHLHPELRTTAKGNGRMSLSSSRGPSARISFASRAVDREESSWYPEFGSSRPNETIVVSFDGPSLSTRLEW